MVRDETTLGPTGEAQALEFATERISVRELIRGRVYQEVREYNARRALKAAMLVPPVGGEVVLTATEQLLNGPPRRSRQRLDWEQQYARALRAFERGAYLILVDDRQVEDLDDEITLTADTQVAFLRLVPLVGG